MMVNSTVGSAASYNEEQKEQSLASFQMQGVHIRASNPTGAFSKPPKYKMGKLKQNNVSVTYGSVDDTF